MKATRILSLLLALLLCVSLLPAAALADEEAPAEEPAVIEAAEAPVEEPAPAAVEETVDEPAEAPAEELPEELPVEETAAGSEEEFPEELPVEETPAEIAAEPVTDGDTATSGTCGTGVTWSYADGVLTISYSGTGTGAMDDYNFGPGSSGPTSGPTSSSAGAPAVPWSAYNESIKTIKIGSGVTYIGENAFIDCTNVTDITLPVSLTGIGGDAFFAHGSASPYIKYEGTTAQWSSVDDKLNTMSSFLVHCSDGTVGFAFSLSNGVMTITGEGTMPDYTENGPKTVTRPWEYYFDSVTSVVIESGAANIGALAFDDFCTMESITIPSTVKAIGEGALRNCNSLQTVKFGGTKAEWNAVTIGANNTQLQECTIICTDGTITPATSGTCGTSLNWTLDTETGMLTISGSGAMTDFDGASPWHAYRRIITGSNLSGATSIGSYAFEGCSVLADFSIPATVQTIGAMAFSKCAKLTSAEIPSGVTSIAYATFEWCTSLQSVSIPTSVTSIAEGAFFSCYDLADVSIPSGVTTINTNTFACCTSMAKASIPDTVTTVEDAAFSSCTALTDVYYSGTKAQWQDIKIGQYNEALMTATIHCKDGDYQADLSGTCGDSTTWTLQNGVLTISGTGAVSKTTTTSGSSSEPSMSWESYSDFITTVIIKEGVTGLGSCIFGNLQNLTRVDIPSTITSIGDDAFLYAPNLQTVNYSGTKAQWNSIGNAENNIPLQVASVICTDGTAAYDVNGTCGADLTWKLDIDWTRTANPVILVISGTGEIEMNTNSETGPSEDGPNEDGPNEDTPEAGPAEDGSGESNPEEDGPNEDGPEGGYSYRVAPWAEYCTYITGITINEGVTGICNEAFGSIYNYGKMKTVTLPKSVTSIGEYAFVACYQLETVIYNGTKTDRDTIKISTGNTYLTDAVWQYASEPATHPSDGWATNSSGDRFYYKDNTMVKSDWVQDNGSRYYMGADGIMVTGIVTIGDDLYLFDSDGKQLTGWQKYNDDTYYADADNGGALKTGTATIGGSQFVFSDKGVMTTCGHLYDAGTVTTPAACTTAGVRTYTCSVCGKTKTESIPAAGHTPVTDKAVAATCVKAGLTEGSHCSVCNTVLKAQETVPATGVHTWDEGVITTKPTANTEGVKTYTCTVCGKTYTEVVPAVPVTYEGTGWTWSDDSFYYFDDGVMAADEWLCYNGAWYYLDETGAMVTGVTDVPGYGTYDFSDSGAMNTDCWVWQDDQFFYFGSDGRMVKDSWALYNGTWYYLDETGAMVTGLTVIPGDAAYCFSDSGKMQVNTWIWQDGDFYYFGDDGRMVTSGWLLYAGSWYYLDADGVMATGVYNVPGDATYYFSDTGAMQRSRWLWQNDNFYYFGDDGRMVKANWLWYNGSWYYLGSNGAMLTGTVTVPGYGKCSFTDSGVWIDYVR